MLDAGALTLAAPPGHDPGAGGLAGAGAIVEPVAAPEPQVHDHAVGQPARRRRAGAAGWRRAVTELAGVVIAAGITA